MHPNPAFRWTDEAAMREFVRGRGFATICAVSPNGPVVAHAPLVVTETGMLRFHVARNNRIRTYLDGAAIVASVTAADGYISPDWYCADDQVPTWNYVAVEIEGRATALDESALVRQVDALSDNFEGSLAPKPVWRREKMTPGRFEMMLPYIECFELVPTAWHGTRKASQNKPTAQREALAGALAEIGRVDEAALVRSA